MTEISSTDSRRITAEHNLTAILDATERLLAAGEQPTISAVAHEAGVSRPTVYAHFPDRATLIEGLVKRTVSQAMAAIASAHIHEGSADEALQRLIAAGWQQIADHDQIARAAAHELSGEAMRTSHKGARAAIGDLFERGRREGLFRTDVPTGWLVTATLALMHATADEVRDGGLAPEAALRALQLTIPQLVAGG